MISPELWDTALQRLASRVSPQNFDMWLRPIECVSVDGSVLRLRAPNAYVRLWFESNDLDAVLREIRASTGAELRTERRQPPPRRPVHQRREKARVARNRPKAPSNCST